MESLSALLTPFNGVTRQRWMDFPHSRPVLSFGVFLMVCLNKLLNKRSRRQWFETHPEQGNKMLGKSNIISSWLTWTHYVWWRLQMETFPRYWPFVQGIHRSPVNSPHKGRWRGAFMFSLICAYINGWVNNGEAGDLRHHRAHYDVTVKWSIPNMPGEREKD